MKIFFLLLFISLVSASNSFGQKVSSKLFVYTQILPDTITAPLELSVNTGQSGITITPKIIKNNSITAFDIVTDAPVWVNISLKQNNQFKAGAGMVYIKQDEVVKVFLPGFFTQAVVTGGENDFILDNPFLLFELPRSMSIHKDYTLSNLRKVYKYETRYGDLYGRLEEYKKKTYNTINQYNDYDFTLKCLYENRETFPLYVLDSAKNIFSDRIKATPNWKQLDSYIKRAVEVISSNKVKESLLLETPEGKQLTANVLFENTEFTFVDFWASWCGPCIQQIPELKELYKKVDNKKISFVAVSIDEEKEK